MFRRMFAAFAGIAMLVGFSAMARGQVDPGTLLKQPAPDFTLPTVDGKTVKLADQKGKVVVMEFWRISTANAIPTLLPFVQQLASDKTLAQEGVVVWGMTGPLGQSEGQVTKYMKDKGYTFAAPFDADFKTFKKYLNHTLPVTVIVGRDGMVVYAYEGWDQDHVAHLERIIENEIDSAANGFNGIPDDLLGEPAPAIAIKTFDGKPINVADLKGKVVLVDFWANWCPHCAKELPFLEKLSGDAGLAKKGLAFVSIAADIDEKEDEAKAFYVKHQFTFPAGFDTDGKVAGLVNLQGVPTVYLIGRDGTVHNVFTGFDISSGPRAGGDISKDIERAVNTALAEPGGK